MACHSSASDVKSLLFGLNLYVFIRFFLVNGSKPPLLFRRGVGVRYFSPIEVLNTGLR